MLASARSFVVALLQSSFNSTCWTARMMRPPSQQPKCLNFLKHLARNGLVQTTL